MSKSSTSSISMVRADSKVDKLREFIEAHGGKPCGSECTEAPILLIAKSPESPVAKALAAASQAGRLFRPVRAIFATIDTGTVALSSDEAASTMLAENVRLISNSRLLEAHEQLVLGDEASWTGDCMRRDMQKRDCYESYAVDSRETANYARRSFEQLWAVCDAVEVCSGFGPAFGLGQQARIATVDTLDDAQG